MNPALQFLCLLVVTLSVASQQELPTVYEHFTENGISSGLHAEDSREFVLNGKPIRIISGAIHYFRIHPTRWRDSLRKLRAIGANTVETYVPWNLHEPERGSFDFGEGTSQFSPFMDIKTFVKLAQEEDLLVLIRPGPYICTEWEFGGFPSWLLRDPNMRFRMAYQGFLDATKNYLDKLLQVLTVDAQFTRGGPVIGVQLENEYAYFDLAEKAYLQFLANVYKTSGWENTLLYTSDGPWAGDWGALDGVLMTGNFARDPASNLDLLLEMQPNRPLMVMEWWVGWFDVWFNDWHNTGLTIQETTDIMDIIMSPPYNGSVNFYMFHGGTNFGFMNGGRGYKDAKVTSYDYGAPLSEAGDYTEKYNAIEMMIEKHENPKLKKPIKPIQHLKEAYDVTGPMVHLTYDQIVDQIPATSKFQSESPTAMELLDMNNGNGQSYGYIVHRFESSTVQNNSLFKAGIVKDFATVVVDGKVQPSSFSGEDDNRYWILSEREISLEISQDGGTHQIDLMIENLGRVNGGYADEYIDLKGLPGGHIYLDGVEVKGFEVIAMEFKSDWINSLQNFQNVSDTQQLYAPSIVQSTFQVVNEPLDTYLDLTSFGWRKGIAFINGFNIGRYFNEGPQQRLYVPAAILKTGDNTVTIFEQLGMGTDIKFRATPNLG